MRKIITHFKVVLTLLLPVTVSAQQIQWQSCMASQFNHWFGEEKPSPDLLCGYLSVPLKYTDTGGDASYEKKSQVKLALTKLPAKSKHKGSILIISGGPGLPGINLILTLTGQSQIFVSHGILLDLILEASDSPLRQ